MLTLTNIAAQVIRDLSSQVPDSAEPGIRISARNDGTGSLLLSLADGPETNDEVVEAQGARIFLDQTAADILDDKALDADIEEGGAVAFLVTEQLP